MMSKVKELNNKMLFLTIVSMQHVEPQVKSSVLHWTFSSKLYPIQAGITAPIQLIYGLTPGMNPFSISPYLIDCVADGNSYPEGV